VGTDIFIDMSGVGKLPDGWARRLFVLVGVGFVAGCWIAFALLYPLSSLPLPRYTMVWIVLLGPYVDYYAGSMLDRILLLLGAVVVAFVVAFAAFTFPALAGWHSDPIAVRSLYLTGLRRAFLFTLPAAVLLVVGTFAFYLIRQTYLEVTR